MRIVAVCGAGVGTSAILKVNAERALDRLGLTADVSASDLASIAAAAADAQVIITSTELAAAVRQAIGRSFAEVVEVVNYFDVEEIGAKLANAFNDSGIVGRIARATTADEVRSLLGVEASPVEGAGA